MPTYTYECKACGVFEDEHSIKQDAHAICPKCGGKEIKRLIGQNTNFILKGSGFYQNDYKNKPEAPTPCAGCDKAKSGECGG